MFKFFNQDRSLLLFLFFLPFMTGVSIYLYQQYTYTTKEIHAITHDNLVQQKLSLIKNYISNVEKTYGKNYLKILMNSKGAREHYECDLRVLVTPEVKYLYLLRYKAQKENLKLYYVLDTATDEDERALFNQPFIPESDIWKKVKETGTVQVKEQEELESLWISLVVPVIEDGEVVAAIGVDFANEAKESINNVVLPLEKLYFYTTGFMLIMLIAAYIQYILFYRTHQRSVIDPLTKIYNRQYLDGFIEKIHLNEYQILMIDIDFFKKVNDLYGHDVGDIILSSVSQRILSLIRNEDTFIRYGGEEFLLFLKNDNSEQVLKKANEILEVMRERPIHAKEYLVDLTLSIGINPTPFQAKNIDDAIKVADEQLYIAKTNGRDRVEVFDVESSEHNLKRQCINDVKIAIDEGRIKCAYQAIFDVRTGEISKYELLVRMIDTQGEVILPDNFLPSVSRTQVYTDLTKYILDTAKNRLKEMDEELSVNLALQDLFNDDILKIILSMLNENLDVAKRLTFEILETEEILDFKELNKHLKEIRATGAKIALDDFGSGYANFGYLVHLHIDLLKIDGSLIQGIDSSPKAKEIVETINIFAKKLGIKTIAEKVETEEELVTVQEMDIDYVQGYFLARPSFN